MDNYLNPSEESLEQVALKYADTYQNAAPFPSIAIPSFFNEQVLDKVLEEFPDLSKKDAIKFDAAKEIKFAGKGERFFGPETRKFMHYLNSEPFLKFIQTLTGIQEPLIGDPYFEGAGQHEIKRGGLLKVHSDFNKHALLDLDRRVNVLVYLNKDWKEEYGGHFELWDQEMTHCVTKILPEFNTMAIFSTTSYSYHGHPDPLNCPDDRSRKSLALYYYSTGRPAEEIVKGQEVHSTLFKERKDSVADKNAFQEEPSGISIKAILKELVPPLVIRIGKAILGRP